MLHHEKKVCEWLLISLGGILLASGRNCQCLLSASQAKMMLLMIQLFLCFLLFLLIKGKNIQIGPKTSKQTKEIQTMITVSYFNNIQYLHYHCFCRMSHTTTERCYNKIKICTYTIYFCCIFVTFRKSQPGFVSESLLYLSGCWDQWCASALHLLMMSVKFL